MGLFRKRKSRATRRAEAKALKAKAKLEAKLGAKNEIRRIKSEERSEAKALRAQLRSHRDADRAAVKVAEAQLKAVREGKLLSPARVRRLLTVGRMLAPILVPLAYRAATAARGFLDERKADKLGVPLSQVGQFSGQGGQLSARIAGAEQSVRTVARSNPRMPRPNSSSRRSPSDSPTCPQPSPPPSTCRQPAAGRRIPRSRTSSTASTPT